MAFEGFKNWQNELFNSRKHGAWARYSDVLDRVNALEPEMAGLSDEELLATSARLRRRFVQGSTLEELQPEAFALVREVCLRKLGKRHYDVQVIGGAVLHDGSVAEMATGEGKSLTALLPAYLNALSGSSVYIITVNNYLARRDAEAFAPVFESLGLKVAYVTDDMHHMDRQLAYATGAVVYLKGSTLAFDHIRDCIASHVDELLLPEELGFAVVDEADLILVDSATTPHLVSMHDVRHEDMDTTKILQATAVAQGMVARQLQLHMHCETFRRMDAGLRAQMTRTLEDVGAMDASRFTPGRCAEAHATMLTEALEELGDSVSGLDNLDLFTISKTRNEVDLSQLGSRWASRQLNALFGEGSPRGACAVRSHEMWHGVTWGNFIAQALNALLLFPLNVSYMIGYNAVTRNDDVVLIDLDTGRARFNTVFMDLRHQFLQAKHSLAITRPSVTRISITYATLFRRFKKVAGMSGTAHDAANSLWDIYSLSVVQVPPNRPCVRADYPMIVCPTEQQAADTLEALVTRALESGRPMLIGTSSTAASQQLHAMVKRVLKRSLQHNEAKFKAARAAAHMEQGALDELLLWDRRLKGTHVALLNADAREAAQESMTIAQAGMLRRITVATNMAGRGTDILLGGDAAQLALLVLAHPFNHLVLEAEEAYDADTGTVHAGLPAAEHTAELQGWVQSFDKNVNPSAAAILEEWRRRREHADTFRGVLGPRYSGPFQAVLESHMPGQPRAWNVREFVVQLKRLVELAAARLPRTRTLLEQAVGLSLDGAQDPPLSPEARATVDPMLQWLDQSVIRNLLAEHGASSRGRPASAAADAAERRSTGASEGGAEERGCEGEGALPASLRVRLEVLAHEDAGRDGWVLFSDVLCAVCAAAMEEALERGLLTLPQGCPTDVVTYILITIAWLEWRCCQDRAWIIAGGDSAASPAAGEAAKCVGGLTVLQWGVSQNLRIEQQLRGRAGRQGDPGETYAIFHPDDESASRFMPIFCSQMISFRDGRMPVKYDLSTEEGLMWFEEMIMNIIKQAWTHRNSEVQNALRSQMEQDTWLDGWREIVQRERARVLQATRTELLAMYMQIFQVWLPGWLQRGNEPGQAGPAVDAAVHPRLWNLRSLISGLEALVNPPATSDSSAAGFGPETARHEAAAPDEFAVIVDVVEKQELVQLEAFFERGGGLLPFPGASTPDLELWAACNMAQSQSDQLQLQRLLHATGATHVQPWRGEYSVQASVLTSYLSQLLVTRLARKQTLVCHSHTLPGVEMLRAPLLREIDLCWADLLMTQALISGTQHLAQLEQMEPQTKYRSQLAVAFKDAFMPLVASVVQTAFALTFPMYSPQADTEGVDGGTDGDDDGGSELGKPYSNGNGSRDPNAGSPTPSSATNEPGSSVGAKQAAKQGAEAAGPAAAAPVASAVARSLDRQTAHEGEPASDAAAVGAEHSGTASGSAAAGVPTQRPQRLREVHLAGQGSYQGQGTAAADRELAAGAVLLMATVLHVSKDEVQAYTWGNLIGALTMEHASRTPKQQAAG